MSRLRAAHDPFTVDGGCTCPGASPTRKPTLQKTATGHATSARTRTKTGEPPTTSKVRRNEMNPKLFRQGDILIIPVDKIPRGTNRVARENGRVVLAHGEVTGHHHSIVEDNVELVTAEQASELRTWLRITAPEPVALTHQEHDTIMLPPGSYEVRRQREYSPEQIRNVAD